MINHAMNLALRLLFNVRTKFKAYGAVADPDGVTGFLEPGQNFQI